MTTQHRRVITKILVSAAIALGSSVGAAAPASADPNAIGGTHPNLFGVLSCSCQETAPPGSPAQRKEEIERGIRVGLSAWLPGLPPPTQPTQPQP
jgi:hypothetical protein